MAGSEQDAAGADGVPEVRRLADFVPYQEGAVVSRTVIKRPTGTVTLFAFDTGEGLSEHTAPYDALAQVFDGEAEIRIDGVPYTVAAGEMMVMPAGRPHSLKALKRFQMMLVMVRS
jgi:quercetin dioxygenase-like cupin family protein